MPSNVIYIAPLFCGRAEYVKEWGFLRGQVFIPYVRTRSDETAYWWKRVPNGRNEKRRAAR